MIAEMLQQKPWRVDAVETLRIDRARTASPRVDAALVFLSVPRHHLKGLHGLKVLEAVAEDFNAKCYFPSMAGAGRCWADKAGWRGRETGMRKVGAAS